MKYMLMFWDDDTAGPAEEDDGAASETAIKSWVAAAHPLARSATVEVRPFGDFPGDE
jgi:hypothetical protein